MSPVRRIACVLLPFAAGYYLSFLFRSINALIASDLTADLGLHAADLGLLTSMYFVAFAAVQLPCGILLDRYGPRLVDSALLLIAGAGSLLFALAGGVSTLMLARVLIGLGVAVGPMAGLKAIVLWFPPERIALANGWYIMLGALGALTAMAAGGRPLSRRGASGRPRHRPCPAVRSPLLVRGAASATDPVDRARGRAHGPSAGITAAQSSDTGAIRSVSTGSASSPPPRCSDLRSGLRRIGGAVHAASGPSGRASACRGFHSRLCC